MRQNVYRKIWSKEHGKIPKGCQIHHINGDKKDNRLENLHCCTQQEHSRIHSKNYIRIGEEWLKYCSGCKEYKTLDSYNECKHQGTNMVGIQHQCKSCTKVSMRKSDREAYIAKANQQLPEGESGMKDIMEHIKNAALFDKHTKHYFAREVFECLLCGKEFKSVYRNKAREEKGGSYYGNRGRYNHSGAVANMIRHIKFCKKKQAAINEAKIKETP